jgi:hypothetical protein
MTKIREHGSLNCHSRRWVDLIRARIRGGEDADRRHQVRQHYDDGETYEHDVIIRLSGEVEKRRKKLSKETYGTSHIGSKAEAMYIFEDGCDLLIVGAGQERNLHLSSEASKFFEKKECKVIVQPTPEAISAFNQSRAKKIALMHVTC